MRFTGITNSEVSQAYLRSKLANFGDQFDIVLTDFYDYEPDEQFDSIVIMGVIEHLPNYERVLKKFASLLKPGGRVFLDGSAWKKKYELSSFMVRHIYPGNHSFLVLDDLLNKLAKTELELMEVQNDRWSYFLTFKQWALNLEANKDYVQRDLRRFRVPQIPAVSLGRGLRVSDSQSRLLSADALQAQGRDRKIMTKPLENRNSRRAGALLAASI